MAVPKQRAFDLVVIGGGTAGLRAVYEALKHGAQKVALVEKRDRLGGECILNACVPTKTMFTASELLKRVQHQAPQYGIHAEKLTFNFQTLRDKVESVIQERSTHAFLDDDRVTRFVQHATFISRREVNVGDNAIRGEKIIICTGSEPVVPHISGLENTDFKFYIQASHLDKLPRSLAILGGGPSGVEYAQFFQWVGCQVTLIEKGNRILKTEEPEISRSVEAMLRNEGVQVYTSAQVQRVSRRNKQFALEINLNGETRQVQSHDLLVVTGMRPRLHDLDLASAGIQVNGNGIIVNDELQTTAENIWAVGDVIGDYRFTHVADYQARIAVENAMLDAHRRVDYHAVPWAIFTHPSVAHVGMTEDQARRQYSQTVVIRTPADTVSRFRIESETGGFLKLLVNAATDEFFGAHIFAVGAEDIIQPLTIAIQNRMKVKQLRESLYIYPAKVELVESALAMVDEAKAEAFVTAGPEVSQVGLWPS